MKPFFVVSLALSFATPAFAREALPPLIITLPQGSFPIEAIEGFRVEAAGILGARNVALLSLRKSALEARSADGGVLSSAHKAAYQAKLDQLNADYWKRLYKLRSVNSDGTYPGNARYTFTR